MSAPIYTIRKTWHYGNEYKVTEHTGAFIIDALYKAAPDMPDSHYAPALTALRNGDVYDGWSWCRFQLI